MQHKSGTALSHQIISDVTVGQIRALEETSAFPGHERRNGALPVTLLIPICFLHVVYQ